MDATRVKPVEDKPNRAAYARSHGFCLVCGSNTGGYFGLSTHHVMGRPSDETCNLFRVCLEPCHQLLEGLDRQDADGARLLPKLTLGMILTAKRDRDGASWNPERLAELLGKNLPDLEPLPDLYRRLFALREDY